MATNKPNEPAFPADEVHGDGIQQIKRHQGLTIRQYAAIQAMSGLLASRVSDDMSFEDIAKNSWQQADSLLAAEPQNAS